MKIAVYSKPYFPSLGGLERNTDTLCRALLQLGHSVHLITETPSDDHDCALFRITRTTSSFTLLNVIKKSEFLFINGGVSIKASLNALISSTKYGIIHHNYLAFHRSGNPKYTIPFRRWIAEHAALNVFTSAHSQTIARLERSTTKVIFNPVDPELYPFYGTAEHAREKNQSIGLLYAGRLIEGKGVFVFVEALKLLDRQSAIAQHLSVVFAGDGPAKARLSEELSSLTNIEVKFAGVLNGVELIREYERAHALVVPSTTHKEGNPLVVAEALYAGTPIIASDQPPMKEAVGNAGIIVSQGNPAELAGAIKTLFDDGYYTELERNAVRRRGKFKFSQYVDEVGSLLGSVM